MFLVGRDFVCKRLKITVGTSYRMLRASSIAYISSDAVIALLNRTRKAGETELDFIPSDILTPEEAEKETGIDASKLVLWTHRKKKVPPHFRLSTHAIRFRKSSLDGWIDRRLSCRER